jgi:hypothetical protein
LGLILAQPYQVEKSTINAFFSSGEVDGIEIHTLAGHEASFATLWGAIGDQVLTHAKVLAVSFPDMGGDTVPYLETLQRIISSHPSWDRFDGVQIWQADGRPMSGDIGRGTVHQSTNLAAYVLSELDKQCKQGDKLDAQGVQRVPWVRLIDPSSGKHFVQLAGGTNNYSGETATKEGLIGATGFGGFAFGGYARKTLNEHLHALENAAPGARIEDHPAVLARCLTFAASLLASVKGGTK